MPINEDGVAIQPLELAAISMKWLTREIKFQSRRKASASPSPDALKTPEPASSPSTSAPSNVQQPKPVAASSPNTRIIRAVAPAAAPPTPQPAQPTSVTAEPQSPASPSTELTRSLAPTFPIAPQSLPVPAPGLEKIGSSQLEHRLLGSGAEQQAEQTNAGLLMHDARSPANAEVRSVSEPGPVGYAGLQERTEPAEWQAFEPPPDLGAVEEFPEPGDISDLTGGPVFADSLDDAELPQPLVPRAADEPRFETQGQQFPDTAAPKPGLRAVPQGSAVGEHNWISDEDSSESPLGLDEAFQQQPEKLEQLASAEFSTELDLPQPLVPRAADEPRSESHGHQSVGSAALKPELRAVPEQPEPGPSEQPTLRPVSDREEEEATPDHAKPSWSGLRPARHAGRSKRLIGDVVVDLGYADRERVEEAVAVARAQGRPTGQVLVEQGVLRQDQLAQVIAERFGLDYIDLSVYEVDMGAANLLDIDAVKRYQAVPVGYVDDGTLLLAMADPTNVLTVDDVAMITSRRVRVAVASAEDVKILITKLGRMEQSIEDIVEDDQVEQTTLAEEADQDAPAIKLVHSIIAQAVSQGASDIHVNPEEGDTRVLFRVDGVLYPAATVRKRMAMSMVSRIKIMSDLDIAERRVPQDGRFAVTIDHRRIDVRVVTLPLVYGEGAVMRILDKGVVVPNLEYLGMQKVEQDRFDNAIHRPNGAVLVTGPTGSGKSTTLYAALSVLNNGERSILTIEDPVESRLAGVKQMQIAAKAGVTFETGLRSMLRADPDVIMVGEIRDRETAHIAVEAALTGHMVLSTLHTRDAPSALGRLMDMGIEPFLVSSSIDCVVAQRLVRMLCQHCRRPMKLSPVVIEKYSLQDAVPFEPVGCSRCGGSGYRGRVGLYEVMSINEEIRGQILEHASVDEIAATAVRNGMRRLYDDGMDKVREGQTSIAEVERMAASLL
jgi:type IV pilus assembly protein PilB